MIAGFTGTQQGMTTGQVAFFSQMLEEHKVTEIHLGDCVGSDTQAYWEAKALGIKTVGHPPDVRLKRSNLRYDEERAPLPYLHRNHELVSEVDLLFVAPRKNEEELRSGTWATARYARKTNTEIVMIER